MEWDLKPLFKNQKDLEIGYKKCKKNAKKFESKYKGGLEKLEKDEFNKALSEYEDILEEIGKIGTYVFLRFALDSSEGAFYAKYSELINELEQKLLFFEIEFNSVKPKFQDKFIRGSKQYSYYLRRVKDRKKHQLSLDQESVLLKKEPVGESAFVRLFDEHINRVEFEIDGEKLSEEEVLSRLYNNDRETRKKAADSLSAGLNPELPIFAYIFNMVKSDLKIETELREYKSPEEPRHKSNQISQMSVDCLVETTLKSTDMVSNYYNTKAKLLNLDKLYDYDRYAPISGVEQKYDYEASKELILNAFDSFSPMFSKIVKRAFEEDWIDVYPKKNKRGGAFSHGAVKSVHPYILLNHTDRRRDIFTLAHELGHSIHQYLSYDVGYLNADTPLTTAETASVFAEMLLFDKLKEELPKEELISLYAGKIEDIFATLFRQIIFTTFERRVHAHEGELSIDTFNAMWLEENQKMFNGSVELTENYKIWWSYIPHFIHSPFYCYAYSYGQLLVLALFGLYKSGFDNFEEKYIKFLKSGGSKSPKKLVEMFGFDIDSDEFWQIGLKEVSKLVDSFMEIVDAK